MVASISVWWVRILAFLGWLVAGVFGIFQIPGPIELHIAVLTVFLAVGVVLLELLRPGGALFTTGLGLTPRMPVHAALGTGVAFVSLASIAGVAILMGATFMPGTMDVGWLMILGLVTQSVAEEFIFRGTIFEALRERFGPLPAIALTSVVFGVFHAGNPGSGLIAIVNVVLAGVLMGTMVFRTGSLWMAIMFHVFWNLTVGAFFGSVSGSSNVGWVTALVTDGMPPEVVWFITGPFGIEQGMVTTIVLTAGIVVVNGWVHMDRSVATARLRRERTASKAA